MGTMADTRTLGVQHAWPGSKFEMKDLDALHERAFGDRWGSYVGRWRENAIWDGTMTVTYDLTYPGGAAELQAALEEAGATDVMIETYHISPTE
jgi:hypothetical protein